MARGNSLTRSPPPSKVVRNRPIASEYNAMQWQFRDHNSEHLSGEYEHLLQVVAFNTAEGWSRDVTRKLCRRRSAPGFFGCSIMKNKKHPGWQITYIKSPPPTTLGYIECGDCRGSLRPRGRPGRLAAIGLSL